MVLFKNNQKLIKMEKAHKTMTKIKAVKNITWENNK